MPPLNEVSRLREFQFRIAGKWWEVVYGVEAGFSGPGFSGFKGFSGLLSRPEFTRFTGSTSRELPPSGYPDVRREPGDVRPFNLPVLESRSPNSSLAISDLAISEDFLLARLQKKLRPLKAVKRLRNRQEWKATLDKVQLGLDVAGMVPVIGNAADLLNLCISLGRGNYGEAAMNAVSMLPGSQVVTGAKLAIRSGRRWRKAGRMRVKRQAVISGKKQRNNKVANTDQVILTKVTTNTEQSIVNYQSLLKNEARFGNDNIDSFKALKRKWEGEFPNTVDENGISKVVRHHAVEQQVLTRYPKVVTRKEMHSMANLRGIPKDKNSDIHLSKIRREWNKFYKKFESQGKFPTKDELLQKATEIDDKYGHLFDPPIRIKNEILRSKP